jgi:hypothetical protein
MSAVPAGQPVQKWTWMRWLTAIAIVFILHVALIFVFGSRKPAAPVTVRTVSSLSLASEAENKQLALNDATLFALPDPNGFAELMWVAMPPLPFRPQNWSEDPQWLAQTNQTLVAALGAGLSDFVQTNRFTSVHLEFNLPPPLAAPALPTQSSAPESTMQMQGEIANRRLLNPIKLPAWPATDIIAPTVVQVLVDGAGDVVSATLLPPENFSDDSAVRDDDANQYALKLARAARFAPLSSNATGIESNPVTHLSVGQLVFNWQSVPLTAANPDAK